MFNRYVVRLHGFPKKIVSNLDEKFTSKLWKELFVGLGINLAFTIAYHPKIDGKIERVNMILKDMLRMYVMH